MAFPETGPLADEIISLLSDKLGQRVIITGYESLSGGCIHSSTRMMTNRGDFFLKWNSQGPKEMFIREAECLEKLKIAADNQLIVPEVLAVREIGNTPGFLLLEYLNPDWGVAGAEEKLGRGLAAIHRHISSRFGFDHDNYCGLTLQPNAWQDSWFDFYRENRLRHLLKLIRDSRNPDREELKQYDRLLDRLESLLPKQSIPALIHGDLWSGNYMITKGGAALIDPASCFADREMEFGMITLFGGFSQQFFHAYQEAYPLPDGWQERNKIYQWYHILNHYYLFGGGYREQARQIARYYAG
jgi:fructosamine-3-kinase